VPERAWGFNSPLAHRAGAAHRLYRARRDAQLVPRAEHAGGQALPGSRKPLHSRRSAASRLVLRRLVADRPYDSAVTLTVVVADDALLVREGVQRVIDAAGDLDVVGVCGDYDTLLALVDRHGPDVVVTDIRMPPTGTDEGIRAAVTLRRTHPRTGVVVLSQFREPGYALTLLEDGSRGRAYLLKERVSERDQLVNAIREVARGGSVIDPMVVESLVAGRHASAHDALRGLTPRERAVLSQVAQGQSNEAVARSLSVSERAVEKHINALFAKLGLTESSRAVNKRVTAVLLYLSSQSGPERGG
jgi:DNA-binding NarL/FixJ family response regulator